MSLDLGIEFDRQMENKLVTVSNSDSVTDNLLEEHGDFLFRYAMIRLRDQSLAEEVVQETLLKAIKNFSTFRGDASLRTWLVQILRNEISGFFRKKERDQKLADKLENEANVKLGILLNPHMSVHEFQSEIEKEEFWNTVQSCYSKLPEHLLETFLTKLQNDESTGEEICKELEITASNFAVRMFRARVLLRKCLESEWFKMDGQS